MVGHDEDDSGIGTNTVGVADGITTTGSSNGRVFHSVVLTPVLTGWVSIIRGDFHIIHIVLITAHSIIRFNHLGSGLLARTASGIEEIDEYSLATVENVEQMDFGTVAVSSRKVNGLGEWALRLQAKT